MSDTDNVSLVTNDILVSKVSNIVGVSPNFMAKGNRYSSTWY